jgi:hypothetical protein
MGEKMMGVRKENAELRDDQMADVSFYALPFGSPLFNFCVPLTFIGKITSREIEKKPR